MPGDGVVDGRSENADEPSRKLEMQVVRAIVDPDMWRELNRCQRVEESQVPCANLADSMKDAIEKKASDRRIPRRIRPSLTLVLDATRLPVLGFDSVVADYRNRFAGWTTSLGSTPCGSWARKIG